MWLALRTGSASARARADPHWGEALSLLYLRNSLPPPTDPQEPRSHTYRGETLPLRPLRPAFPAQESTTTASAPETWSCYQHQSALPHFGGALAERWPTPLTCWKQGKRPTHNLVSLADLGMGPYTRKAPPVSETATTLISHWGELGWQIPV